jgi:LmbE family N-acetylglucosaminyl deacetylase
MSRFDHRDPGRDDETWRALPQWVTVPPLRLDESASATVPGLHEKRLVVVVAHPDDETLACGGLLARAAEHDVPTVVVIATDGEASHPDSPTHPPGALAARRRAEVAEAVQALHPTARLIRLGLPDGALAGHQDSLTGSLSTLVDGATLLVSTWRGDGHGDHEAVARAASDVAARAGARHLEAPIWLWFWGEPGDVPWEECAVLPLTPGELLAKEQALACYASQTSPLSDAPGDEAVLGDRMLAGFRRAFETYVEHAPVPTARRDVRQVFDQLHQDDADPWRTQTSWYEDRRRALVLASLPWARAGSVLEVGCSVGELTAALAERADETVAVDVSEAALTHARQRCAELPVRFERLEVPHEWPAGEYDVVVLSEIGYFLSEADLLETLRRACGSLTPDGALLLVHWRHEVEDWPLDGPAVHGLAVPVAACHGLTAATHVVDDDVLLDLYRPRERTSPAQAERTGEDP